MKDVPTELPEGLVISATLTRADPFDAFVANHYGSLTELPTKAIIGTSSLRRQAQLQTLRSDLQYKLLRGNINSRIDKLDSGEFDAIILAVSGLTRINLSQRIRQTFKLAEVVPACGQGIIGIETRQGDQELHDLLQAIHCQQTYALLTAERTMNAELGGNCQTPIGAYAYVNSANQMTLHGLVAAPNGERITANASGFSTPVTLGQEVAQQLITKGALELLNAVASKNP